MATKTHDASSSSDCGCKKNGMIAQKVGGSQNLEPVLIEFVGATPLENLYIGKATKSSYNGVFNGAIFNVYLADYRADVDAFYAI